MATATCALLAFTRVACSRAFLKTLALPAITTGAMACALIRRLAPKGFKMAVICLTRQVFACQKANARPVFVNKTIAG